MKSQVQWFESRSIDLFKGICILIFRWSEHIIPVHAVHTRGIAVMATRRSPGTHRRGNIIHTLALQLPTRTQWRNYSTCIEACWRRVQIEGGHIDGTEDAGPSKFVAALSEFALLIFMVDLSETGAHIGRQRSVEGGSPRRRHPQRHSVVKVGGSVTLMINPRTMILPIVRDGSEA